MLSIYKKKKNISYIVTVDILKIHGFPPMNSDHWDLGVFIYKNLFSTEVVYNNVVASSLCLYNYTLVLKLYAAYTILIKIYIPLIIYSSPKQKQNIFLIF